MRATCFLPLRFLCSLLFFTLHRFGKKNGTHTYEKGRDYVGGLPYKKTALFVIQ